MSPSQAEVPVDEALVAAVAKCRAERSEGLPRIALFLFDCPDDETCERVLGRIPPSAVEWFEEIVLMQERSESLERPLSRDVLGRGPANLRVHRLPRDAGYGGARKAAFEYATLKGFDHVVTMRGDGLHPPEALPALIHPVLLDPEQMVFAHRRLRLPEGPGGWKWIPNLIAHTLATGFQNRLLGLRLRDYHSGYRLYSMEAIRRIPYQLDSDDPQFDMQMVIQCRVLGVPITEVPVGPIWREYPTNAVGLAEVLGRASTSAWIAPSKRTMKPTGAHSKTASSRPSRIRQKEWSEFQGQVLDGQRWHLPVAVTRGEETPVYRLSDRDKLRVTRERLQQRSWLAVHSRRRTGESVYLAAGEGRLIREADVLVIQPTAPPAEVGEGERWIDVDLTHQVLVAYEWKQPRYVTLVSTGRTKTPSPELNYRTPKGLHRIRGKHLTSTMDNDEPGEPPYSLEDVPYVMYFRGAYAFHSAFWHDRFGRPRSHGCINLAPHDAKWLYNWAGPDLPESWHGGSATDENPGTWDLGQRGLVTPPA